MASAAEPLKVEVKRKPKDPEWRVVDTWSVGHAQGFTPRRDPMPASRFGGDPSRRFDATGYFRVERAGDRWWLVDPDGHPFVHVALCSVSPRQGSPKARAAFAEKYGSEERWAAETMALLRAHGFNGTGSWSNDALLATAPGRPAYCPNWNFMSSYGKGRGGTYQKPGHTGYPKDAIFVFDPGFEAFAMEHARRLAATREDPWLLGHFSDNEMPLSRKCLDNYLALPEGDPGREAAREWLRQRRGGEAGAAGLTDAEREAFREVVVERYFAIVSRAIRAHDPNHLYLGCRFHGDEKRSEAVFRAAGRHADVISVNLYGAWTPDATQLANWVRWSGRPFLITEFYAKGMDSGMPNTSGAGWLVRTQRDRGLFYQNFCLGLLESRGCVGWHCFKYADNDLEDRSVDPSNVDSNKGIVTATFVEYPEYLALLRELNVNVHGLIEWIDRGGKVHP
ncbi:MAG: hypothetical protein JXR77_11055 [Lentisphaeria bacterium]|nr:hypothetical protein [Lentisphaeria bacterium]